MGPTRRVILILALSAITALILLTSFGSQPRPVLDISRSNEPPFPAVETAGNSSANLVGPAIAPKLGNETLKAELGRSAWHVMHTVMSRFPDNPTADEQEALRSYIHLFQRLYPCGDCARHFGEILQRYPPQVSSRSAAAAWACHVHNVVNEHLGKKEFDCSKIGDWYDCGCAEDEGGEGGEAGEAVGNSRKQMNVPMNQSEVDRLTGANGRNVKTQLE